MEKLTSTFFYNLEKTVKVYRQYFQAQLKQNGFDITLDQWLTLKMITEYPEASQNEIADKVFKDKASIARIIDILEQNEYLAKYPHPKHLRKSRMVLTAKGEDVLSRLNHLVPMIRHKALHGAGDADIHSTLHVLHTIMENCFNKDLINEL